MTKQVDYNTLFTNIKIIEKYKTRKLSKTHIEKRTVIIKWIFAILETLKNKTEQ